MTERRRRFEELYNKTIDPWQFRTSSYEKEKYEKTVASIPASKYKCGIEAGCSIGELSRLIGERCQQFYGIDISEAAIDEARKRNADRHNLHFAQSELPGGWPQISADLIVLSEILYFLTANEIEKLADILKHRWEVGGDCIVVSFLGDTSEALQGTESADMMAAALRSRMTIATIPATVEENYRIDVLQRLG